MTSINYPDFDGLVRERLGNSEPSWDYPAPPNPDIPNIIYMIADDLGYSDLGCYGSEISTPNLDQLAERGLLYNNFHVTPLCSPTRAALLTGRNPHSVGVGSVANYDNGFPGYEGEISREHVTIAESLRERGFSTYAIGKWHLCRNIDYNDVGDRSSWPLGRGFDRYYGFLEALNDFWFPARLIRDNSAIRVETYPPDYYLTDDLVANASEMIVSHLSTQSNRPFFMYFAHAAVHAPLHAKKTDVEKYKGVYDCGWDVIRQRRFDRQRELGIVSQNAELPDRNSEPGLDVPPWDSLRPEEQTLYARYMEVYAGMVDSIDQSVGTLLKVLDRFGKLDNTIFMFSSDNGASREGNATGTRHYFSNSSSIDNKPGKSHKEKDFANLEDIGGPTTWPHYPRGWAMACNTPFRLYKTTTMRGGHSSPLIVSWPKGLPNQHHAVRTVFTHITDIFPTVLDIVDSISSPGDILCKPEFHGQSVYGSFTDTGFTRTISQYWECLGNRSFQDNEWKVVSLLKPDASLRSLKWHLFNMTWDPTEITDLSDEYPERVAELVARWDEYARKNFVYPVTDGLKIEAFRRPPFELAFQQPVLLFRDSPTLERYHTALLTVGRSFEVTLKGTFRSKDEGILVAHGGQHFGYVLVSQAGHLQFVQNADGQMIESGRLPLPNESREIVLSVAPDEDNGWKVSITIDGVSSEVGDDFVQPYSHLPWEGIDIGQDRGSPVCWKLFREFGTFRYTGEIHRAVVTPGAYSPNHGPQKLRILLERARHLEE